MSTALIGGMLEHRFMKLWDAAFPDGTPFTLEDIDDFVEDIRFDFTPKQNREYKAWRLRLADALKEDYKNGITEHTSQRNMGTELYNTLFPDEGYKTASKRVKGKGRPIGAGAGRKRTMSRRAYRRKPVLSMATYKRIIRGIKSKGLRGGASGAGWFTPWKWDSEDWKAVGEGIAYGADAVLIGTLDSKTAKQLIKTAISTGSSAGLASIGIMVPPTILAKGTDVAVDAFISGIIMAHDYIVGDNPYKEKVDEIFAEADKYAPQIIKGIEIATSAIATAGVSLLENTSVMTGLGATKNVVIPKGEFKAEHAHLLKLLKNPTKEALDAEYKKQKEEVEKVLQGGALQEESTGGSKYSDLAKEVMKKMERESRENILDRMAAEINQKIAESKKYKGLERAFADAFIEEQMEQYNALLALHEELSRKGKGIDAAPLLGMSEEAYLKEAKKKAKKAGYDPKKLTLCKDGKHKLDYDGVKFGAVGYGDFILYKFLEKQGEVPKGTAAKKRRVFRKSHGAMKDSGKGSANQLALAVLWA